jgi:uncharacterized protein YjcR
MSKLADVAYDIEQLYIEGYKPVTIAAQLDIPLSLVYDWLEQTNLDDDVDAQDWDEIEAEEYDPYQTMNS